MCIVMLIKVRKNNIPWTFQTKAGFFNKKTIWEVRERAEKTCTDKLSSSSSAHIAPQHACPGDNSVVQNSSDRRHDELIP